MPEKNDTERSEPETMEALATTSCSPAVFLAEYFKQMRFDKSHHLGLGDIRLTIAQQEDIIDAVTNFKENDQIHP